ncbi:unnamed protein product, partial [Rotaria magnacalcarata]
SESSSIYVCRYLIDEGATLHIYDPKVTSERIFLDLSEQTGTNETELLNHVHIANERYAAAKDSHAIVVCTEWDEFIRLDYELIYSTMQKPSYIFDGRLILDHDQLMSIGFNLHFLLEMIITKTVRPLLEEIFYLGARSSILVFKNVGKLLKQYDESDKQNRIAILKRIAKTYHPQEENFPSQPDGVHSLVHLHAYILKFLPEIESPAYVERMSESLRDLLATWFTTGLLQVERVTWQSPCEIVQRVSEYEAVHRIRNWADLKRRLGPYRRCFAYTHHMMPNDPLVILHVGLVDNISNSIQTILNRVKSVSDVT